MNLISTMNYSLKDETGKTYTEKEWVDYAVACGFHTMEISARQLPENPLQIDEIIAYAKQRGMELSLHAPFGCNNITDTDEENRKKSIAQVKSSIDLAAKHNMRVVTFHPGRCAESGEDPKKKWPLLLQAVAEIAAYAKEKKVRVGIENMECREKELVFTVEDLNRFAPLGEGNPYFGVTLDFVHFATHGITDPRLQKLKLPIFNVHLSQGLGRKTHLPLTVEDGTVDIEAVCRGLIEWGYEGFLVFELGETGRKAKRSWRIPSKR